MHRILNSYLRRLTNLTSRNKSILLLRLLSGRFLDLNELDFLNNRPAFSIVEQLIKRKKEVLLCRVVDSRDETSNNVSQKLRKLWRNERFVFEERGARDLYLGWPFARGAFADGSLVRAPLLFFPVTLLIEENHWKLKPRTDETCYLNRSFLLAYAHFNKVPVDEKLMDFNFEEFPNDSRAFRVSLYELFRDSGFEMNFNQQNFTDNLLPFQNFTKTEFESKHKKGSIKLHPEAVLGLFPQAGSYLVPDYMQLLQDPEVEDIGSLFDRQKLPDDAEEFKYIATLKEEQTVTPFKLDAFQENALKAIKSGKSLVIQGPPGTGKSQLISNIMADYASRRKRVLLVCQKRAALDVVEQRLKEIGMGNFIALVHDFKNDRRDLYAQILQQIESLEDYKRLNGSLDAIQLERQFLQSSRRIDHITEELEEFKHALYDKDECGVSAKELYLTSNLNVPAINLKQEFRHFPVSTLDEFKKKLAVYHSYHLRFDDEDFHWNNRRSFEDFGIKDLRAIIKQIDDVWEFAGKITTKAGKLLKAEIAFGTLESISENSEKLTNLIALLKDPQVFDFFRLHLRFEDSHKDELALTNIERLINDCFKKEGPEVSIESRELGVFQEIIQQRLETAKNGFKWLRWHLFSKEKMQYLRVLRSNGLKNDRDGLKILMEKIDNRLNLEHNLQKLKKYPWVTELPESLRQVDLQAWFYYHKRALQAKMIFHKQQKIDQYFDFDKLNYHDFRKLLEDLLGVLEPLPDRKNKWLKYLMPSQISLILSAPEVREAFKDSLNKEFENLCAYDQLKKEFSPNQQSVVDKIYDHIKDHPEDEVGDLFENGLKLAWIEHIEAKYPSLRIVSSMKLEHLEQEYRDEVITKFEISRDILLLKLRENVYKDVKYNRLNNMISYRDLRHQVSKKKRIWPIRKLLSSFTDELFTLIPCWLASPESVSAITPMREIFDLVIFDEASQCFAEKGIPAVYRSKQVVVTGDSKQLSPNDLYMIRWQDQESEETEIEIDSLLDLASRYLSQVHLQGHYRSKSLELISFSNQHFYQGKLRMLPDFQVLQQRNPSITYLKINGTWDKNINQNEAVEVVMLVDRLHREEPEKSIGIVTFNIQQQQYIMECLEDRASQTGQPLPEDLIVKNIENVQGDEKDIIIFSVGYAPDKNGKLSMNFGSLNQSGGENRLNVAITRARDRVYVVASIFPGDLRVGKSKNDGPRLFKEYLKYALAVSEGKFAPPPTENGQHQSDWYLKQRIKNEAFSKNDYSLDESLPFADLVLTRSDQYLGLLLTDDELYHQSISVKDSHVYVPQILQGKGWKFMGLFSREYWMNPENAIEKVERFAVQSD